MSSSLSAVTSSNLTSTSRGTFDNLNGCPPISYSSANWNALLLDPNKTPLCSSVMSRTTLTPLFGNRSVAEVSNSSLKNVEGLSYVSLINVLKAGIISFALGVASTDNRPLSKTSVSNAEANFISVVSGNLSNISEMSGFPNLKPPSVLDARTIPLPIPFFSKPNNFILTSSTPSCAISRVLIFGRYCLDRKGLPAPVPNPSTPAPICTTPNT